MGGYDVAVTVIGTYNFFLQDCKMFYSGPYAHLMVKEHLQGTKRINNTRWQVFVYDKNMTNRLMKNTSVLHQVKIFYMLNKLLLIPDLSGKGNEVSPFLLRLVHNMMQYQDIT